MCFYFPAPGCSHPTLIPNANPQSTHERFTGATVTYNCDLGFTLENGPAEIVCRANGFWSEPMFRCKGNTNNSITCCTCLFIKVKQTGSGRSPCSGNTNNSITCCTCLFIKVKQSGFGRSPCSGVKVTHIIQLPAVPVFLLKLNKQVLVGAHVQVTQIIQLPAVPVFLLKLNNRVLVGAHVQV